MDFQTLYKNLKNKWFTKFSHFEKTSNPENTLFFTQFEKFKEKVTKKHLYKKFLLRPTKIKLCKK